MTKNLLTSLEKETKIALAWLKDNKMIANPDKFHCIVIKKNKEDTQGLQCKIGDKIIKTENYVKLLGVKTRTIYPICCTCNSKAGQNL